jgi:hypothetical protein
MAKKKLNRDAKRERLAGELATFVRQYGRKAQKGIEPNDRRYSRSAAKRVKKHMKPEQLDSLLRDEDKE